MRLRASTVPLAGMAQGRAGSGPEPRGHCSVLCARQARSDECSHSFGAAPASSCEPTFTVQDYRITSSGNTRRLPELVRRLSSTVTKLLAVRATSSSLTKPLISIPGREPRTGKTKIFYRNNDEIV